MTGIPHTHTAAERVTKARADLAGMRDELLQIAGVTGDQSLRMARLVECLGLLRQLAGGVRQIDEVWGSTFGAMMWLLEDEAHAIQLRQMIDDQERHLATLVA